MPLPKNKILTQIKTIKKTLKGPNKAQLEKR